MYSSLNGQKLSYEVSVVQKPHLTVTVVAIIAARVVFVYETCICKYGPCCVCFLRLEAFCLKGSWFLFEHGVSRGVTVATSKTDTWASAHACLSSLNVHMYHSTGRNVSTNHRHLLICETIVQYTTQWWVSSMAQCLSDEAIFTTSGVAIVLSQLSPLLYASESRCNRIIATNTSITTSREWRHIQYPYVPSME